MVKAVKKSAAKKQTVKFTLDCTVPVNDRVLDLASFEKFLQDRIKLDGKTGVLGDRIKIAREAGDKKLTITAEMPFSKRYLKFLSKKYLKKQTLRDYIRVVSSDKQTYVFKYFSVTADDEE